MNEAVARVVLLAETYSANGGEYIEHGPKWDKERWSTVLDALLSTFAWDPSWEPRVTRGRLLDLWAGDIDESDAAHAFFLTMVWGLGEHFLGPYKIEKMLTSKSIPDLGSFLLDVRRRVASDAKGKDVEVLKRAYVEILGAKISHLGPVYATKLLYAMSSSANRSPVMDVWVERWGAKYGYDFALDSTQKWAWNEGKLANFVSFCDDCIGALTALANNTVYAEYSDRGFVEYLVFWDSKYRFRRTWSDPSEFPSWIDGLKFTDGANGSVERIMKHNWT